MTFRAGKGNLSTLKQMHEDLEAGVKNKHNDAMMKLKYVTSLTD